MPSLSDFKNSFRGDLARQNRFLVFMTLPEFIGSLEDSRILTFRCENAQLPGKTFATTEQKTYGPIEKHPYLATYNDIDLTFIVDDDMMNKKLFDTWINYINPTSSNNFRYRQEYECTITIEQYSVSDELTYTANLYEAYPISINQLDLDWNGESYHKLIVTFAYTYWDSKKASVIAQLPGQLPLDPAPPEQTD